MNRRYSKYFPLIFYIVDLLILNFAFITAHFLKFDKVSFVDIRYDVLLAYTNVSWLVIATYYKQYEVVRGSQIWKVISKLIIVVFVHLLAVFGFWVVMKTYYYSRIQLFFTFSIFGSCMMLWRVSFYLALQKFRQKGYNYRNVIVAGYSDVAHDLKVFFKKHPEHGYKFKGFFDDIHKGFDIAGGIKDIARFSIENQVDEIYCCLPHVKYHQVKELVDFADNNLIKIKVLTDFRGVNFKNLTIQRYDHIPIINVSLIPLDGIFNKFIKRVFDILFSLFVIVFILLWFVPLVGILIKLSSKGPVFFKQKRHGKNGNSFKCWKFRTMRVNIDADSLQASKKDPRITKIGAFLRRTSLDELPQFINVFLGEMSVVGPRPHMVKHTEEYSKLIDKFMQRHLVKPGITGLAQAKGYRGETKSLWLMKNRVRYDLFYIQNWSLMLDVKIIFLTIYSLIHDHEKAF